MKGKTDKTKRQGHIQGLIDKTDRHTQEDKTHAHTHRSRVGHTKDRRRFCFVISIVGCVSGLFRDQYAAATATPKYVIY
jgi:hypothetical protein